MSKNSTPTQKPIRAGRKDSLPIPSDCSIAGISKLQIDAATITPAAKPASERCTKSPSDFFIKNTHAAPSVVPRNGISIPRKVSKLLHRLFVVFDLARFPADKPCHAFHISKGYGRIHAL